MDLLLIFGQSFLVGFSGAMMPGPMFTAAVSESMKRGAWAGPRIVIGHGIIESALVVALIFGAAPFLLQAKIGIAVLGGITLLLMGMLMIKDARRAAEAVHDTQGDPMIKQGPELAGILTTGSNPYFWAWWATIGLSLTTDALEVGIIGVASFYAGHILSDFAWFGFVGAMSAKGREWCSVKVLRGVLAGCGVALAGLGLWFLVSVF